MFRSPRWVVVPLVLALGASARAAEDGRSAGKAGPGPNKGPIIDTHIHVYQVSRKGGVPWPPRRNRTLYKDFSPQAYKRAARSHGITGAVIVEASELHADNLAILKQIAGDPFFLGLVGSLEVGRKDFVQRLDELAGFPGLVGIRAFAWAPKLTADAAQLAHVRELAKRGLTLEILSRGDLNPKDKVQKLARAVPNLRIVIDHLAGAKGRTPTRAWTAEIQALAAHTNVHIKFSSFFDMFNPAASEDHPWRAPTDLASYAPHFDVLYRAFGPDRLVFGSNYPVVLLGGSLAQHIALAEQYLATKGSAVRDKVMFANARRLYSRDPAAR